MAEFPSDSLSRIVPRALIRIRSLASQDDSQGCFHEADHVHNLPSLANHQSVDGLRSYLEVFVPDFKRLASHTDEFEDEWEILRSYLASEARS